MFEKGKSYKYLDIEKFDEEHDYNFIEHGNCNIGENFIVLQKNEITISFVLISDYGNPIKLR
jgi:hypothetical protein